MTRSDVEKMADEELALRLLAGRDKDNQGRPTTRYLKHNSREEKEARAALARRVREQMRGFSGELLALAIDPQSPTVIPGMKPTRRIRFESPSRGKPSEWARDLLIVQCIKKWRMEGYKLEAGITAATEQFGVGRSAVQAIWKRHNEVMRTWKFPEEFLQGLADQIKANK